MDNKNCPICGSLSRQDSQAHAELALHEAPREYAIRACTGCGLRWMTPFPLASDYQEIYGAEYYEEQQQPGKTYLEEKSELAVCYEMLARRFMGFGVTDNLLDIGCGTGAFLDTARQLGLSGAGIEPSVYAAEAAQQNGLDVRQGILQDLLPVSHQYNAVFCSHVLEHVPDAHEFMQQIHHVLAPGAPMYLEVPIQFDGILDTINRLRGKTMPYSDYSIHHHYFFTVEAMRNLLQQHGFKVLSLTTFMPCRRASRKNGLRSFSLQLVLKLADLLGNRGDVISVWARREK